MLLYWAALLLAAADQISKQFIFVRLPLGESIPLLPNFFHLTTVHNTGIAFGLFRNDPHLLTLLIGVCVLLLLVFSRRMMQESRLEQLAYGFILGGAVGNLIDRVRFGWVIDFLDFRIWPVFNLADSGITIGVILFAWKILFVREKNEAARTF